MSQSDNEQSSTATATVWHNAPVNAENSRAANFVAYNVTTDEENCCTDSKATPKMPHYRVYRLLPGLWRWVGRTYPYLDMVGGALFFVGSILIFLGPAVRIDDGQSTLRKNILFLIGISIFAAARIIVWAKALYAELWQRPRLRPGYVYHAAVFIFMCAGIVSTVALSVNFDGNNGNSGAYLAVIANGGFVIGSIGFIVTAFLDDLVDPRHPLHPQHTFLVGASFFLLGSILYIFSSWCALPGMAADEPKTFSLSDVEFCSVAAVTWFSLFGGVGFVLGSALFLGFGIYEYRQAKKGPDPRTFTIHGAPLPHPFRPHEGGSQEFRDPKSRYGSW